MIATITEPTTNALGEPLRDLSQILAFAQEVNGPLKHFVFQATSQKGGGKHTISLDGLSGRVTIQSIAIDLAGNQSSAVIFEVDVVDPKPSPPTIAVA